MMVAVGRLLMFITYGLLASMYGEINAVSKKNLLKGAWQASFNATVTLDAGYHRAGDREVTSMRAPRIMAGTAFFDDKPLLLTFVGIVLVQSVNLLVMQ